MGEFGQDDRAEHPEEREGDDVPADAGLREGVGDDVAGGLDRADVGELRLSRRRVVFWFWNLKGGEQPEAGYDGDGEKEEGGGGFDFGACADSDSDGVSGEDGDEGGGGDENVSGDEFGLWQQGGEEGVFDRAEEGGLGSGEEDAQEERLRALEDDAEGCGEHHDGLGDFGGEEDGSLSDIVRQFPRRGGEQKKRQHKEREGELNQRAAVFQLRERAKRQHRGEGAAKDVVVERPQKLAGKQRRKTPREEQLNKFAHG